VYKRQGKIVLNPEYVFRNKNPAVVGVKVQGIIKPRTALINEEGRRVGTILQIQDRSVSIDEATDGMEVAVSIRGPTIGRQVKSDEILYIDVPDKQILAIRKKFLDDLSPPEKEVLEELTTIKRATGHFV